VARTGSFGAQKVVVERFMAASLFDPIQIDMLHSSKVFADDVERSGLAERGANNPPKLWFQALILSTDR
jgi:hypothetical protein